MNIFCLFRKPIKQNSSFSLCALPSQQRPWYQVLLHAMYSGEPESSHFTTSTECHFNVLGEWLYSLKTGAKNEREKKFTLRLGLSDISLKVSLIEESWCCKSAVSLIFPKPMLVSSTITESIVTSQVLKSWRVFWSNVSRCWYSCVCVCVWGRVFAPLISQGNLYPSGQQPLQQCRSATFPWLSPYTPFIFSRSYSRSLVYVQWWFTRVG